MNLQTIFWALTCLVFQCKLALSQNLLTFEPFKSIDKKALKGFTFQAIKEVYSYFKCYRKCEDHNTCFSVNFYPSRGLCELNYASHVTHQDKMEGDDEATYIFNLSEESAGSGTWTGLGGSATSFVQNCKVLKESHPLLRSGKYWLDVDLLAGPMVPFPGYCDMETDGGGWTLVWSFTFNDYTNFNDGKNYIKPTPKGFFGGTPQDSETPPQNETDMNAMEFKYWQAVGSEFLIKSNINNWVACIPNGGSLVTKTAGNVTCRFIRQIVFQPNCKEVPLYFGGKNHGQALFSKTNKPIYYFEKSPTNHYPWHDPCGQGGLNHKKNVQNPHTNVYIR